jgi:hypothetical protein
MRPAGDFSSSIENDALDAESLALQFLRRCRAFGGIASRHEDVHAPLRQLAGRLEADAFVGAGYQCNLAHTPDTTA